MMALWQRSMHAWDIADWLIFMVVIGCCIGVTIIVLRVAGIAIPPWAWQIAVIVLAAFLGILAIRLLTSM